MKSDREIIRLILEIFNQIFLKTENIQVHPDATKLLLFYLNLLCDSTVIFNEYYLPELSNIKSFIVLACLIKTILSPYPGVDSEKFKFADLLKDEKELEKKRLKAPKTLKSEMKEKITMFIKLQFNKQAFFNFEKNQDEKSREHVKLVLNHLLNVYDSSYLQQIVYEAEKSRLSFIEIYFIFIEKYLKFSKFNLQTSTNDEVLMFKKVIADVETYFLEQIYDSNQEVRKMCLTLFTLILQVFPVGEFFQPLANKYQEMKRLNENELFLLETLQYVPKEEEVAKQYFKNLVKIFTILTTLYIDEKINLGSLVEQCFKQCLQKYPMISVNELIKYKLESRLSRVEALDKIFKKFMKL